MHIATIVMLSAIVNCQVVDIVALEGTWRVVGVEGGKLPEGKDLVMTFNKGKLTLRKDGQSHPYRINPFANPKRIDISINTGDKEDMPGIYDLKGDKLKMYLITESTGDRFYPRPKDFKEKCRGQIVYLERVKK